MFAGCFGSMQSIGAVSRLAANYRRLVIVDGWLDTKSDPGFHAAAVFVKSLEEAAEELGLQPDDRCYRANFSINYRALFQDASRQYRVDILEASLEQTPVIWVNGDKFEFTAEAMTRAETLKQCWTNVTDSLQNWNQSRTRRATLRRALAALDTAWASFEQKYITELIDIEARPRALLRTAIEQEQKLKDLETTHGHPKVANIPEYMDTQRSLVQNISHLNSVANIRRKGRNDLSVEILWAAMKTIQTCEEAEKNGESTEKLSAARCLSDDVVNSFLAMRNYFREASKCLQRVDPQLSHNVGLVKRLVDWEEAWEVGKHYVQKEMILNGICDFVAEIRQAQLISPELKGMCEDCDVMLFMVLPRILWLRGLAKPAVHLHLFESLLPHRFTGAQEASKDSQEQWPCDSKLTVLFEQFHTVRDLLASNWRSADRISEFSAWEVLVKRVVLGSESKSREEVYGTLSPSIRGQAEQAVERFMNELEVWSIEIQRNCPEDWNVFTSIIAQCLSGGSSKDLNMSTFQV
eukprot:TRINITY_DN11991_c0_g3_i1.p1 TRINITY_DN11991_c0_g3~~TRINITY_DN11991_c0_g3_i1.p1  ORF type:complete len:522 (+),score=114.19 TRINITY_DN11991_c0_g3_i1:74-1639(+)